MKARDYYQHGKALAYTLPPESIPPESDGMVQAIQRAALAQRTGIQVEESPRIVAARSECARQ